MQTISSKRFVFDLFLDCKVPSCYLQTVTNTITGNSFELLLNSVDFQEENLVLIKDIPSYLKVTSQFNTADVTSKTITQYPGYLLFFNEVNDSAEYLTQTLSKRNVKNLYSKKRKLEKVHEIRHKVFFGSIAREEYHYLFKALFNMLYQRFDQIKTYNRYLSEWDELYRFVYPKIIAKEASLFVIYDNTKPIDITLNFHLSDIVFSHIQGFDIGYSHYNLGDIGMLNHIDWCIKNEIAVMDLSMGRTSYKVKWSNHEYVYNYHLFYRHTSIAARVQASILILKLRLKQFLRDKEIIGKLIAYDRLFYKKRMKNLRESAWLLKAIKN